MGVDLMKRAADERIDAVLLFPFANLEAKRQWKAAVQNAQGVTPIISPEVDSKLRGRHFATDQARLKVLCDAKETGVKSFSVRGNFESSLNRYRSYLNVLFED